MKRIKFKKRYVLGTGYPWAMGLDPYLTIAVNKNNMGVEPFELNFPKELWSTKLPKYRLVLERVDK